MESNILVILAAALIPMVLGFVWYNPKVFGSAWMKAADMTEEKMEGANMALIFGLSFVLSFILAFGMAQFTIHQTDIMALFIMDPEFTNTESDSYKYFLEIMGYFGDRHMSFGHGVVHGIVVTILLVIPVMVTNALFERKSFKYMAVNIGYWAVCLMLMGGVVCQWAYSLPGN